MAYDSARARVVLFGGDGLGGPLADTWEFDGSNWNLCSPVISPSARTGHMIYDPVRQRVVRMVLFGGYQNGYALADTSFYGPTLRATATTTGAPCPGTSGPSLSSDDPYLGNPGFTLDLRSTRAVSPCLIGIAGTTQNLPLGGGCTSYLLDPVFAFAFTNQNGVAILSTAIPWHNALRGARLYAQAVVLDPQGPALGLQFTAALVLTIGD